MTSSKGRMWQGVWRIVDPKITLASVASLFIGLSVAAHDGELAWGWLALTVLGIFFIEGAKNASGEIVDFDSGTDLAVDEQDRSPFSGGKRVLVDELLTRRQTAWLAAALYASGGACGLAIVLWREPRVLWVGIVGVALAFFYHAPPLKLSYRGLGEAAVAVSYGPLIASGAYLVQRHTISRDVVLLSLPLALLIGAFLWINEFPDYAADASAGKRTWVVRLGRPRAARVYALLLLLAFASLLVLPLLGLPITVLLGLIGAPLAFAAARRLLASPEQTRRIIPAQGWTLLAFVLEALGASVGMLIGGLL
jgi:1,4-dihydroxy-2-naphthoate octaprenyltransferase